MLNLPDIRTKDQLVAVCRELPVLREIPLKFPVSLSQIDRIIELSDGALRYTRSGFLVKTKHF